MRETLTSHGSCPSIKAAAFRRSDGFLRSPVDPAIAPRETRPLCSSPITGPSSLIRGDPPQTSASVLSPRGFGRLCFSLGIQGLVPAVPRRRLCPTHALYTPAAARPVIRLPTGLSQETVLPLVSTAFDPLTTRHRRVHLRSSFGHIPAPVKARTFHPTFTTTALLPQQLGLVWDPLLKADPEGPSLIIHAAVRHWFLRHPSSPCVSAAQALSPRIPTAPCQSRVSAKFQIQGYRRYGSALLVQGDFARKNPHPAFPLDRRLPAGIFVAPQASKCGKGTVCAGCRLEAGGPAVRQSPAKSFCTGLPRKKRSVSRRMRAPFPRSGRWPAPRSEAQ